MLDGEPMLPCGAATRAVCGRLERAGGPERSVRPHDRAQRRGGAGGGPEPRARSGLLPGRGAGRRRDPELVERPDGVPRGPCPSRHRPGRPARDRRLEPPALAGAPRHVGPVASAAARGADPLGAGGDRGTRRRPALLRQPPGGRRPRRRPGRPRLRSDRPVRRLVRRDARPVLPPAARGARPRGRPRRRDPPRRADPRADPEEQPGCAGFRVRALRGRPGLQRGLPVPGERARRGDGPPVRSPRRDRRRGSLDGRADRGRRRGARRRDPSAPRDQPRRRRADGRPPGRDRGRRADRVADPRRERGSEQPARTRW